MTSRSRRVALIGYGRFGRALADLMERGGFSVAAFDPHASAPPVVPTVREVLQGASWVVLAVPVHRFRAALEALAPHLRPDQVVVDVCSVKTGPERALRQVLGDRIPWAATHPLFGPVSLARGERPLTVVVCPNERHPAAVAEVSRLFATLGCRVVEQGVEDHDRRMAETHALAFFIAKGLLDVGAADDPSLAPPSFRAMLGTIAAVREDAGHLFYAIEHENPFAGPARRRLLEVLEGIDRELARPQSPTEASSALSIPESAVPPPDLVETRQLIDELDRELVDLLARRAVLSRRAGRSKERLGRAIRDPGRERALLEQRAAWAENAELPPDELREVFEAVLRLSRRMQQPEVAPDEER